MTDGEGLHDNSTTSTVVSYSELLFSGAADDDNIIDHHLGFSFTSSPADSPPKMLCFGDSVDIYGLQYHKNAIKMVQKTDVLTCINPPSSKKRNAEGKATFSEDGDIIKKSEDGNGAPEVGNKKNSKKSKSANNSLQNQVNRHAKVKKVKLGERILALQQLVSPFGKTDTASVLHEAKGYISFLQDQVQLLCSPYLQLIHQEGGERVRNEEEVKSIKDLRSKGLCLVPIGITSLHVTDDNGADYWSPANALVNPSS